MMRSKHVVTLFAASLLISAVGAQPVVADPGATGGASAAADFPANPVERSGYQVVTQDEFDGSTLDESKWIADYLPHWTAPGVGKPNYVIEDGKLKLRVTKEQGPWSPDRDGALRTSSIQTMNKDWIHQFAAAKTLDHSVPTEYRQAQRYGYFEIRAKVQAGSGHHSAFWMVGTQPDQGKGAGKSSKMNAEIDIFEILGQDPTKILFNLHNLEDPKQKKHSQKIDAGVDLSKSFHVYGLEWEPGSLKLYLDNKLVGTKDTSPDYPMLTFLGQYEGREGNWTGEFDSSVPYPKEFAVDYYRAYQKKPSLPLTIEAETADVYGAARVTDSAQAEGGLALVDLGDKESRAVFRNVYVPTAGEYSIDLKHRGGDASKVTASINDGAAAAVSGAEPGEGWQTSTTTASLRAGFNTIEITNGAGQAPEIDSITVR
ncbi:family 16 glycosylhydrolase [Tsukamurella tyrosinosolvens]|uniref:family 16 glycosylhydrolase n=1 Tax=Tsukamurella tyrosinosolvens TaxID=57704 RepID=UPI000DF6DCB3|nr:family 16 glycosylhydrolase [Tsukamurella tyrosinosolvens]RDB46964.1 hypothetical protein DVB87_15435 [Tsukamurella tyrosinosolvens]